MKQWRQRKNTSDMWWYWCVYFTNVILLVTYNGRASYNGGYPQRQNDDIYSEHLQISTRLMIVHFEDVIQLSICMKIKKASCLNKVGSLESVMTKVLQEVTNLSVAALVIRVKIYLQLGSDQGHIRQDKLAAELLNSYSVRVLRQRYHLMTVSRESYILASDSLVIHTFSMSTSDGSNRIRLESTWALKSV